MVVETELSKLAKVICADDYGNDSAAAGLGAGFGESGGEGEGGQPGLAALMGGEEQGGGEAELMQLMELLKQNPQLVPVLMQLIQQMQGGEGGMGMPGAEPSPEDMLQQVMGGGGSGEGQVTPEMMGAGAGKMASDGLFTDAEIRKIACSL